MGCTADERVIMNTHVTGVLSVAVFCGEKNLGKLSWHGRRESGLDVAGTKLTCHLTSF